jgi:hypothetical protein
VRDRTLGEPVGGKKATKISVALKVEFCNSSEGEIVGLSRRMESVGRSGPTELGNCHYKGLISATRSSIFILCSKDEDSTSLRNVRKLLPSYTALHSKLW